MRKPPRRCAHVVRGQCWACYRARKAAALFGVPVTLVLCQHCERKKAIRPRTLCWRCYADKAIRALYPAHARQPDATPKLDKLPLLPLLDHYPDHTILPRCRHGLHDGTCAACEQEQRAGLVFAVEGEDTA